MDEVKYVKKSTGIYNYKNFNHSNTSLTIKDIDPVQGIVTGYFSAFGIVDSDGDMMMPGAFKRSIQDWGPKGKGRVKHLYNHDPGQPLGLIKELDEDNYGLPIGPENVVNYPVPPTPEGGSDVGVEVLLCHLLQVGWVFLIRVAEVLLE